MPGKFRFTFLAPAVALLVCSQAPARADSAADFEAMRQSQRRQSEVALARMPEVAAARIADVMRLGMENRTLVLRVPLATTPGPGYARAKLEEFEQPVMLRVIGGVHVRDAQTRPSLVVPAEFLFQAADYSKPRSVTNVSVSQSRGGGLSLAKNEATPDGSRNVHFIVRGVSARSEQPGVTLSVTESKILSNAAPFALTLTAADVHEFLRRHGDAVEKYLRPMLAELGQEAVFAPDPLVALQVFPEHLKPDAPTVARVRGLLPELAAADYHARDRATADLERAGREAVRAMIGVDRSTLSPEQNVRVDRVLGPLGLLPPDEAKRLRGDVEFLLNCLYSDDAEMRKSAVRELEARAGVEVSLPEDLTSGARHEAARELRKKLLPPGRVTDAPVGEQRTGPKQ